MNLAELVISKLERGPVQEEVDSGSKDDTHSCLLASAHMNTHTGKHTAQFKKSFVELERWATG